MRATSVGRRDRLTSSSVDALAAAALLLLRVSSMAWLAVSSGNVVVAAAVSSVEDAMVKKKWGVWACGVRWRPDRSWAVGVWQQPTHFLSQPDGVFVSVVSGYGMYPEVHKHPGI